MLDSPETEASIDDADRGTRRSVGAVARMYHAAATGFTRRKQVAISSSAWSDWLVISKLEYVAGENGVLKATQATGQHIGSEIYFEASTLRAVRVF